jgi:hypothetical protein
MCDCQRGVVPLQCVSWLTSPLDTLLQLGCIQTLGLGWLSFTVSGGFCGIGFGFLLKRANLLLLSLPSPPPVAKSRFPLAEIAVDI